MLYIFQTNNAIKVMICYRIVPFNNTDSDGHHMIFFILGKPNRNADLCLDYLSKN